MRSIQVAIRKIAINGEEIGISRVAAKPQIGGEVPLRKIGMDIVDDSCE